MKLTLIFTPLATNTVSSAFGASPETRLLLFDTLLLVLLLFSLLLLFTELGSVLLLFEGTLEVLLDDCIEEVLLGLFEGTLEVLLDDCIEEVLLGDCNSLFLKIN
jgi:hypothetical protein